MVDGSGQTYQKNIDHRGRSLRWSGGASNVVAVDYSHSSIHNKGHAFTMKHTVEWTTGILVAVALFFAWITLCDWLDHINRLVALTKPFV